jgi:hypothetical protein
MLTEVCNVEANAYETYGQESWLKKYDNIETNEYERALGVSRAIRQSADKAIIVFETVMA